MVGSSTPPACEGTVVWTYRYTACDGTTTADWTYTYTIEYVDFTPPAPGGSIVSNPDATDVPPTPPTVKDNCGNTLSPDGPPAVGPKPTCGGTRTYKYTYTDCAGNSHDWLYTYTVECNLVTGKLIWLGDNIAGVGMATVTLSGDNTGSDVTGSDGIFEIYTGPGSNFIVTPLKNNPSTLLNGVGSEDVLALQQHIIGMTAIDDKFRLVAADANNSKTISTVAASVIRQALPGNPTARAIMLNSKSWRFIPTDDPDYQVPTLMGFNYLVPGFDEFRAVSGMGPIFPGQDFWGVKLGDVAPEDGGNADPANRPGQAFEPVTWIVRDRVLRSGKPVQMDFTVQNFEEIAAYQFGLKFDPMPLRFDGIEVLNSDLQLDPAGNFGLYDVQNGEIRTLWSYPQGATLEGGAPVFRVKFTVLQGGYRLSDAVQLDPSILYPAAYNTAIQPRDLQMVYVNPPAIGLRDDEEETAVAPEMELLQNRPNPFSDQTIIGFVLPEACDAQLRILSIDGREVFRIDSSNPAGYNQEVIRMDQLGGSGVYYYELTTPSGKAAKKMVVSGK